MKNLKIILITISCFLVALTLYKFNMEQLPKDENLLIVGTSLDYPPYALKDLQTDQPVGFDIDIISEIATRLHKKLILKDRPFSSLILGLLTNDLDMVAAGMSPTDRRAKLVSFSKPYLQEPLVILTKAKKFIPQTIHDLEGKTIAVNTGYFADHYMSQYPNIQFVRLDSSPDCFRSLQADVVDGFVCVNGTVKNFLNKIDHPEQFAQLKIDGDDAQERCALVVGKKNIKLLDQVNQALDAMNADGTMEKIKQKWGF